jgi:hypothetical protein
MGIHPEAILQSMEGGCSMKEVEHLTPLLLEEEGMDAVRWMPLVLDGSQGGPAHLVSNRGGGNHLQWSGGSHR